MNDILRISCDISLRRMPQNLIYDKSTLVHEMAWCCQATSHYLSQCLPKYMSPYSITRPQGIISSWPGSIFLVSSWVRLFQHIDGLVQERHNSSALAMEWRLSCTNPSISCVNNARYSTYNFVHALYFWLWNSIVRMFTGSVIPFRVSPQIFHLFQHICKPWGPSQHSVGLQNSNIQIYMYILYINP